LASSVSDEVMTIKVDEGGVGEVRHVEPAFVVDRRFTLLRLKPTTASILRPRCA
jgi:hypothetical protein